MQNDDVFSVFSKRTGLESNVCEANYTGHTPCLCAVKCAVKAAQKKHGSWTFKLITQFTLQTQISV